MDRFGTAAVFNNLFLQPLDVIKTRQILSSDNIKTIDLAKNIWNNEGVQGLYSGVVPSILISIIQSLFKNRLKNFLVDYYVTHINPADDSRDDYPRPPKLVPENIFLVETLSYGLAGAALSVFTSPLDVIRVAMQADRQNKFLNAWDAFTYVWREQGFSGFWRGLVPAAVGSSLYSAALWAIYSSIKKRIFTKKGQSESNVPRAEQTLANWHQKKSSFWPLALSLFLAGVTASVLDTPFDVLKTRLQADMVFSQYKYKGLVDAVTTIKNNNSSDFFAGIVPKCLRAGLAGVFSLTTVSAILFFAGNDV
eukprot:TRINITY_DN8187_c0_g1_i1.p1 TRINITY_DN8187_c0_g1~~TRINITY_DN8187_c0_g1_i1.p1  ORF type:complete len:308 (-),score=55.76 TRINITY_DN8187_c0_g1_i1:80-1003(-)